MATFPWMTRDFVRKGMTGAEGWVYYNWARDNQQAGFGLMWRRRTPGYARQEYERLKAEQERKQRHG